MFGQEDFQVRCEWGERGVDALAPSSDAIILVDVMSFSTCVSIATARGACILPWPSQDPLRAQEVGALLAGARSEGGYSLSPASLRQIPAGTRLLLPSPNGSTLSLRTGDLPTFAGCFRNARAVAEAAWLCGPRIAVIPAGERWKGDGSLRPCFEDLVGAGAVLAHLPGTRSPEAELALRSFQACSGDLCELLASCSSGRELIGMGYGHDLPVIASLNADPVAPRLRQGAYSA